MSQWQRRGACGGVPSETATSHVRLARHVLRDGRPFPPPTLPHDDVYLQMLEDTRVLHQVTLRC